MDIVILSGKSGDGGAPRRRGAGGDSGVSGLPGVHARGGWHVEALERAFAARGHRVRTLPFDALTARMGGYSTTGRRSGSGRVRGSDPGSAPANAAASGPAPGRSSAHLRAAGRALDAVDAVVVRIVPRGSLEQIVFRMDALHRLEALGIPVVNPPSSLERTVDKLYTSFLLADAGLPTPPTVVAEREADALAAFRELGDVVVKPLFGANGRGMVRVTDEEIAFRLFRALELERAVYYLQRTIPHAGRDIRAFVVGGRVVAAAWRCAPAPGYWRTNIARGGRAQPAELPPEWAELCVRAAAAVGAEYAGVDLLPASDGSVWVLEVNGIPGWKGVQGATGVDIPGAIVDLVEARVRARR